MTPPAKRKRWLLTQLLMLEIAQTIDMSEHKRSYGLPSLSHEFQALREMEAALAEGRPLMGRYPSQEQRDISKGLANLADVTDMQGPEVDMFQELRSRLEHIKAEPLSQWDPELKSNALIAFKQTDIIVSTNNNLASNIYSQHFGSNGKPVILIRDEDPKELEVNGWIGVTKCNFSRNIAGIVLGGDSRQLQPTVLTAKDEPGFNEFSKQMETSLVVRLIKANHPLLKLTEQRRFRLVFARFLNKRVYKDEMKSNPVTRSLKVKPEWEKAVRYAFDISPIDPGYFVLSLEESFCSVDRSTMSRYNVTNVKAVMALILANHEHGGYKGEDIKIVTPYAAQRNLYRKALCELSSRLPESSRLSVETADTMQGKEAKVIILDMTISDGTKPGDLGFLKEDNRCNVAQSRMKEVLITVIPEKVQYSTLGQDLKERMDSFGNIVQAKVPYPVDFVKRADQTKMIVHIDKIKGKS
ncbi:hypothetical protein PHISCL_07285 [Aspergillus sclerotialis]|uniref:DNA2/NAM7 helicase-like C-terminal domain-containing protein n=1 Tax=Aspergillus sclerotialis TaxID=2070753 RepID=A0A3A2ZB66_9EURO|nr:hypothetical protein PHISCL_07285 [Aspergillus sclerotialis]